MSLIQYDQVTGHITDEGGNLLAVGWAGNGDGKNNPAMQDVHNVGPLPQGLYEISDWEYYHNGLGHDVVALHQKEGETFGRFGFFIHGPSVNPDHYGEESKGCIVVPREARLHLEALKPDWIRVNGPSSEVVPDPNPETPVEEVPEVPTESPTEEVQ